MCSSVLEQKKTPHATEQFLKSAPRFQHATLMYAFTLSNTYIEKALHQT